MPPVEDSLRRLHGRIDETHNRINETHETMVRIETKMDNVVTTVSKINGDIYDPNKGIVTKITTLINQSKIQWFLLAGIILGIIRVAWKVWLR